MRSIATALFFACLLTHLAGAAEVEFMAAPPTPRNVEVKESPCGDLVVLHTYVIPKNKRWLIADQAQEFDASGRVLLTWRVPNEPTVLGVDGTTLVVWYSSTSVLRITLDGHLTVVRGVWPEPERVHCPASLEGHDVMCVLVSPSPRRLVAYSAACT